MFSWFKKKNKKTTSQSPSTNSNEYSFRWYEANKDNPFNVKVLDVRSYTQTILAFTKFQEVAEKFNDLRQSLGEELIDVNTTSFDTTSTHLEYPHNGEHLEGIVFKADSMDCKWDIYAYENYFFFSRSWDGELVYKAKYTIQEDKIIISEISFWNHSDANEAINDVHFLIKSHAIGQVFPHKIPDELKSDQKIAQWSFVKFGNRACYASYDDITNVEVTIK